MKQLKKTKRTKRHAKLMLRLRPYGTYVSEACELETILARKPARLQIDMVGSGEMPPDSVLLIRSILLERLPRTRVVTHARSSLQGAAVLVWLLGDTRLIRDDARLHFRSAGPFASGKNAAASWKDREFLDDNDLEEEDYIRVLQSINEFLPVKELADRPIEAPELKQFGLIDNEKTDHFLAAVFRKAPQSEAKPRVTEKRKITRQSGG